MEQFCFLFGHSDAPEKLTASLYRIAEQHYLQHCIRNFVVGNHGQFDRLAIRTIVQLKKQHPTIRLLLLTPNLATMSPMSLPEGIDECFYPDGMESVPPRYAILRANQAMLKKATTVICYAYHTGNAYNLWTKAVKRPNIILLDNMAISPPRSQQNFTPIGIMQSKAKLLYLTPPQFCATLILTLKGG